MADPYRTLRLMALFLVGFVVLVCGINWVANPYGAWPTTLIDGAYRNPAARERQSTPYLVRHERPAMLLVGSSRTGWGIPVEQGYRDGVLNASLPAASLNEIAAVLDRALQNPDLKRVIWGLDFYAFDACDEDARDAATLQRLNGGLRFRISETLLSLEALADSRKVLARAVAGRRRLPATSVAALPWPQPLVADEMAAGSNGLTRADHASLKAMLNGWMSKHLTYRLSSRQLRLFRDTVERVRAAGIDLQLFIGPMSELELEVLRQAGAWDAFLDWKRRLAAVAPYWDFSGYNALAYEDQLYLDAIHFKGAVGQAIFRRLLGEDCSACGATALRILDLGVRVDDTNVERHLDEQDTGRLARLADQAHAMSCRSDRLPRCRSTRGMVAELFAERLTVAGAPVH